MSDDNIGLQVFCTPLPSSAWATKGGLVEGFTGMIDQATKANFMEHGFLAPVLNVLGFDPQEREQLMHYSILLSDLMEDEQGKDLLAHIMPQILSGLKAFCSILSIESWTVDFAGADMTVEQAMAEREKHGGLAHHPDRVEVVTLIVETRESNSMVTYPILRDSDGEPTGLGENIPREGAQAGPVQGRFAQWLLPIPAAEGAN